MSEFLLHEVRVMAEEPFGPAVPIAAFPGFDAAYRNPQPTSRQGHANAPDMPADAALNDASALSAVAATRRGRTPVKQTMPRLTRTLASCTRWAFNEVINSPRERCKRSQTVPTSAGVA